MILAVWTPLLRPTRGAQKVGDRQSLADHWSSVSPSNTCVSHPLPGPSEAEVSGNSVAVYMLMFLHIAVAQCSRKIGNKQSKWANFTG